MQIALHRWLILCMALVALMVLVGGLTRLTESGLSIVKWKLVTGTLPPLSADAWQAEFMDYQTSPQYKQVNRNFALADFKQIYWLEYLHRLIGRVVGLVIFVPYIYFVIVLSRRKNSSNDAAGLPLPSGEVKNALARFRVRADGTHSKPSPEIMKDDFDLSRWERCAGATFPLKKFIIIRGLMMAVLVALQGAVGWVMVASGLQDQPRVEPLKLALHLSLAFSLFLLMLWTDWQLRERPRLPVPPRLALAARGLFLLVFLQVVFGALVAGLRAGLSYNTYPLMDGQMIPNGLWLMEPWWKNHLESVLTVQFQHRMLAVLVVLGVVGFVAAAWKRTEASLRGALKLMAVAVLLQFGLGVATLLSSVNHALASMHQLGALLLLSASLQLVYRYRG